MTNDNRSQQWLAEARAQAETSRKQGGIPIGAVLVNDQGEIIAHGHNRREQNNDPTAHAEIECIRDAGRRRDWNQCTLVSTLSPCPMCAGTAILFGIPRVIVGENQTFQGAEQWMRDHGIEVVVLNDPACVQLMREFQEQNADLWNEDIGR